MYYCLYITSQSLFILSILRNYGHKTLVAALQAYNTNLLNKNADVASDSADV